MRNQVWEVGCGDCEEWSVVVVAVRKKLQEPIHGCALTPSLGFSYSSYYLVLDYIAPVT